MTRDPVAKFQIRTVRFPGGDRIPMLCQDGLPLYLPTAWTVDSLWPKRNATSTIAFKLRTVGHWLQWCERNEVVWQERVLSSAFLSKAEIVSVSDWMRLHMGLDASGTGGKVSPQLVAPGIHRTRMLFLGEYLRWVTDRAIYQIQGATYEPKEDRYRAWWEIWETSRPMIRAMPVVAGKRWGLTPNQREVFLKVIKPDFTENPFAPGMRVRNYAILLMLYDYGMRMAEPLMLNLNDLDFRLGTISVTERPNDSQDPRGIAPSPMVGKNRCQRGGRLLKFTSGTREAVQRWIDVDRRDGKRFPGGMKSPYVFLSERGLPLAVRSLNRIFEVLRERFPELGERFSPHILRHDWNDRFVEIQVHESGPNFEIQKWAMGWSQKSQMPGRYGQRAVQKVAGKISEEQSAERQEQSMRGTEKEK